jgi:hypothetical protein
MNEIIGDMVTRDEFEAFRDEMAIRGDDQTIMVEESAGWRTIKAITPINDDGAEFEESGYIDIAYDAGDEEFTVTITELPWTNVNRFLYPSIGEVDKVLKFTKPSLNKSLDLFICNDKRFASPTVMWIADLASTDATTNGLHLGSDDYASQFATVTLNSNGTYVILEQPIGKDRLLSGPQATKPYIQVSTSTNEIKLNAYQNAQKPGFVIINKDLGYTEPVDDRVILGWTDGADNVTFDFYQNRYSYDQWTTIGIVQIDADNNVEIADLNAPNNSPSHALVPKFGYTGTAPASATLTIQDGVIIAVT